MPEISIRVQDKLSQTPGLASELQYLSEHSSYWQREHRPRGWVARRLRHDREGHLAQPV